MTDEGERRLAGRYRLLDPIGRGGMGRVWRAADEVLGREVAVKELLLDDMRDEDEREEAYRRVLREARSAARLAHPGVVTVHDVLEVGGRPWIVMELLPARSLQEIIAEEGPLPVAQVAEIGRQVLAALDAAHAVGVLHRDVKPANVLVSVGGRVVLTDFGIARVQGDAAITRTGQLLGSPMYMAPERLRGQEALPASDLWGVGATLYAAVEGRPPFARTEAAAVIGAVLTAEPPVAERAGELRPVIDGLLRKDPRERLTSAAATLLLEEGPTPRTRALEKDGSVRRARALEKDGSVRRARWWGAVPAYAGVAAYGAIAVLNLLGATVAGRAGMPTLPWFWVWTLVATVVVALTHAALVSRGFVGAGAFAGQVVVFSLIVWGGYDFGDAGLWTLAVLGGVWGVWLISLGLRSRVALGPYGREASGRDPVTSAATGPLGVAQGAVGRMGVIVAGIVYLYGLVPQAGLPRFPTAGAVIAAAGYALWAVMLTRAADGGGGRFGGASG